MPFFVQLPWKMSAKDTATMARMPKSPSAQGACSRLEPQPKFAPETRKPARSKGARLRTKSARLLVVVVAQIVEEGLPRPLLLMVFRNCLGRSASVSMLSRRSGAAVAVTLRKGSISGGSGEVRTSARWPVSAEAAAVAGLTR